MRAKATAGFRLTALALALFLFRGGAAIGQPVDSTAAERPNLILITVDTLRADHLSTIDPQSPVATPAIDAIGKDGVLFTRTLTTTPLTTPAHASLMTGVLPPTHGARDFVDGLPKGPATLAETLERAGYRTAGFVSAAVCDRRTGLARGFSHFSDGFDQFLDEDSRVSERPGKETLDHAVGWLDSLPQGPFFVWLHFYEPHDPYEPPEPYRSRFREDPYAGEVAAIDGLVAELVLYLKNKNLYDSSVISLLSDHGEGLGDHGETKHGFFVYQSTMHIPWLLKATKGDFAGRRVADNASIVDVFPTLLHVLGISRDFWPRGLHGVSRYRAMRGQTDRSRPVYFESVSPFNQFGWSELRGLVLGDYKLIEAPQPELYNLVRDPGETSNQFSSNRAMGQQLRQTLIDLESRLEPVEAPDRAIDPELQERLRSLGYVGVSSPVRPAGASADLADPKEKVEVYELVQQGVEAARQRRWTEAIRLLSGAAEKEPASPAILTSLALAYRDSGQLAASLDWFRKTLDLRPEDTALRLEFSKVLLALKRTEEAGAELERVVSDDPNLVKALFNLGILRAQQSRYKEASSLFGRALALREDSATLRSLALSEFLEGRSEEAEKHLLRALELDPADRRAHLQLAQIYSARGEVELARRHDELARRP